MLRGMQSSLPHWARGGWRVEMLGLWVGARARASVRAMFSLACRPPCTTGPGVGGIRDYRGQELGRGQGWWTYLQWAYYPPCLGRGEAR